MVKEMTPVEGLLIRAGVYELLAVGYAYPDQANRQRVFDLAEDLAPWISQIHADWSNPMQELRESLESCEPEELEADFNRLFSGAVSAAPFETSYEPDIFRKQATLADIAGFYRAFGFQIPDGSRWQHDHVGVELEYCSILLQRTAIAVEHGGEEQAVICVDALRKFLLDHLGRWHAAFADDLSKVTELSYYRRLAAMTREWLEAELRALDLQPDRLRSRKIYEDDAETPSCGGCTGCGPEGPTRGAPCPLPLN